MNFCKCNCGEKVKGTWSQGHNLRVKNPMAGKAPWNKGKTNIYSDEQRRKIREARARQQITEAHRSAISSGLKRAYQSGKRLLENCPFYIDGRTRGVQPIKKSFEYREWRKKVFERDDFTCQQCGIRGGEIQADHILPQSAFPELRFDLDNGRTLCRPCHQKTDTWGQRHWVNRRNASNLLQSLVGTQS